MSGLKIVGMVLSVLCYVEVHGTQAYNVTVLANVISEKSAKKQQTYSLTFHVLTFAVDI